MGILGLPLPRFLVTALVSFPTRRLAPFLNHQALL